MTASTTIKPKRAVVLMSGGLDSTVLGHWAIVEGYDIVPLFVNYGQHCAEREFATLRRVVPKLAAPIEVATLRGIYENASSRLINEANLWDDSVTSQDLYLPYRNMLLLSTGTAHAAANRIATVFAAFINSNHALEIDATFAFLERTRELTAEVGDVRLELPFRGYDKSRVAQIGSQLGVPIAETFSCQINSKAHCGACPNCVDRLAALRALCRLQSP
jgi:7-cyano-7-deazaguanine synthase